MTTQDFHQDDIIPHGEEIVERFGGIRPMASKLNVPVTTVQGWKKRDAIPAIRRDEILNAAAHYDVNLKGLVGETANENARASIGSARIAEDPALTARPAPAATTIPPQRPRVDLRSDIAGGVDLSQIRKTARRTSFVTTVCLAAIIGGAGFLLFGAGTNPSQHITSLENRVGRIEQQSLTVTPAASNPALLDSLQKQMADITTVIGASGDSLSQMARDVAAGSNAPLLQRLAVIEKQLTSGAGASPALTTMVDRMQDMAAAPQGSGEWQAAIADLKNIVGGLQGRMDGLDTALAEAKTQNDALGRTLADVSGRDLGAAAMLMALMQLRESADRQQPFTEDLELLRNVAQSADPQLAASVEKMAPYAQSGILSPAALKRELQASANDIVTARLKGEDVSMKEKIMGRLQNLLSIRKDGTALASDSEQALIQKAGAQLDANDVAGAMATLQQLQGPAAEAAAPWQNKAAGTLAAQMLDGQLVNAIVSKIKTGAAVGSTMPGVVNAGPINMAPEPATPAPAPTLAPPSYPAPAQMEPQAGTAMPDMPAPEPVTPTVIIQQ